jgi:hypothetical protein
MAKKKKENPVETIEATPEVGPKGAWKITFEKLDGTIREMVCTKDIKVMEKAGHEFSSTDGRAKAKNENIETIFDLEKMAWRSFRKANLRSAEKCKF